VGRFEDRDLLADVPRAREAEAAHEAGEGVRHDVAEEVLADDDP